MKDPIETESTDRLLVEQRIIPFLSIIGERDTLIGNGETFNSAFRYYRAGDCVCETCGLSFSDHPVVRTIEKRHYGCELHVLCNTDRVKL